MRKFRKPLAAVLILLLLAGGGFAFYVSDYYPASVQAAALLDGSGQTGVTVTKNLTILTPDEPNGTGLLFYPGGKVEHIAYLPLLERLRDQGVTCVLVEMPFRLAVFDPNAADGVFEQFPEIETWYMGGHSLGGAMASSYAAEHPEGISGVILLGSYLYGGWPAEKSLTIYGSEDLVLDRSKITYTENVIELEGGNHAQFGSYGPQKGDGQAAITAEEQQALTALAILDFMENQPFPT